MPKKSFLNLSKLRPKYGRSLFGGTRDTVYIKSYILYVFMQVYLNELLLFLLLFMTRLILVFMLRKRR